MRRTILLSLFALLALSANDAFAQRRGGGGTGFARGGYGFGRGRGASHDRSGYGSLPYGFGYADLPYDSENVFDYAPQPAPFIRQRPTFVQPPAPPVAALPVHPVVTNYNWPVASTASSYSAPSPSSEPEPQAFAIVLKNGSTLSAEVVVASDDGLQYVDPDERHLRVSMSQVDRAATLKLNRARNLNLYLPAAQ